MAGGKDAARIRRPAPEAAAQQWRTLVSNEFTQEACKQAGKKTDTILNATASLHGCAESVKHSAHSAVWRCDVALGVM
jgi:hypothetical protein